MASLSRGRRYLCAARCDRFHGKLGQFRKEAIVDAVTSAKNSNGLSELRLSIIGYRDWGDGSNNFQIIDFRTNDDIQQVRNHLNTIGASGGGDAPEDVAGALWQAFGRSWRAQGPKIILHIADEPAHGYEYNNFGSGRDGRWNSVQNPDPAEVLRRLGNEKGVCHYYFFRIKTNTDMMVRRLRQVYENDVQCANFHELPAYGASITNLIHNAITDSVQDAFKPSPPSPPEPPALPPSPSPPPRKSSAMDVGTLGGSGGGCAEMVSVRTRWYRCTRAGTAAGVSSHQRVVRHCLRPRRRMT